MQANTLRS